MNETDPLAFDPTLVAARFTRKSVAELRDSVVETEIGHRLLAHLEAVRLNPERVLDLGCGINLDHAALRTRFPDAYHIGVDLAFGLLARPENRPDALLCSNATTLALASASMDLVYSNLTLGWIAAKQQGLAQLRRVLRPGGLLALSILGPDTLRELRDSFAEVDSLPHVHSFPDMHDVGDWLASAGFIDVVVDAETITVEYRELSRLMADLRSWGVGNSCFGRRRTLTGKHRWEAMRAVYERYRQANGTLAASVEVSYVHAWAPEAADVVVPQTDFAPFRSRLNG